MRRVILALGAAAVMGGGALVTSTPASAFLDFLFARPQAAAPAPASRPLDISVRPKRAGDRGLRHKKDLARKDRGDRPTAKARLQQPIDPVANPDWYLTDPTLRNGDILVLKSGPVVYKGASRRTRSDEDFVSLGQSRMISKSSLRNIRMMVSGIWAPPEPGEGAVGKRGRASR